MMHGSALLRRIGASSRLRRGVFPVHGAGGMWRGDPLMRLAKLLLAIYRLRLARWRLERHTIKR